MHQLFQIINNQVKIVHIYIFITTIYLCLTLPIILDQNHYFYNLEPYPDGLIYVLSARNLINRGQFGLVYQGFYQALNQPPLYSFLLSLGFLTVNKMYSFVLVNIILGIGTIFLYLKSLYHISQNKWLILGGGLLFLAHQIFVYLPILPMTENLALFLISALTYLIVTNKKNTQYYLGFIMVLVGLPLTRFALFPVSAFGFILLLIQILPKLSLRNRIGLIFGLLVLFLVLNSGYKTFSYSLIEYGAWLINQLFLPKNNVFAWVSLSYIWPNCRYYFSAIFGLTTDFLWLNGPITTPLLVISIVFLSLYKKIFDKVVIKLLLLSVSPLLLLLIFYSTDSRYFFYTLIPIMVIFIYAVSKTGRLGTTLLGLTYFTLLLLNSWLIKINASGLAQTTTAWQYEAIRHFNLNLSDHDMIITALPPYLVDAYQANKYQALPLSNNQEFIDKGQKVWGENIDYENLSSTYQEILTNGQSLFITNAYITHSTQVITDYEKYKELFVFDLVASGCHEACNIYQLKIKQDVK